MGNLAKQPQESTGTTEQIMYLAISTDILIYMKSKTEFGSTLINGSDTKALLIEGEIKPMMKLIDRCFEARQFNDPVKFEIDGHIIIFK